MPTFIKTGYWVERAKKFAGELDLERFVKSFISGTRVLSVTSASQIDVNVDNYDMVAVTALAVPVTINNPTGSPSNGQGLVYRILATGSHAITLGSDFREIGSTVPATTTSNKVIYIACVWNSQSSTWDIIGVKEEA